QSRSSSCWHADGNRTCHTSSRHQPPAEHRGSRPVLSSPGLLAAPELRAKPWRNGHTGYRHGRGSKTVRRPCTVLKPDARTHDKPPNAPRPQPNGTAQLPRPGAPGVRERLQAGRVSGSGGSGLFSPKLLQAGVLHVLPDQPAVETHEGPEGVVQREEPGLG